MIKILVNAETFNEYIIKRNYSEYYIKILEYYNTHIKNINIQNIINEYIATRRSEIEYKEIKYRNKYNYAYIYNDDLLYKEIDEYNIMIKECRDKNSLDNKIDSIIAVYNNIKNDYIYNTFNHIKNKYNSIIHYNKRLFTISLYETINELSMMRNDLVEIINYIDFETLNNYKYTFKGRSYYCEQLLKIYDDEDYDEFTFTDYKFRLYIDEKYYDQNSDKTINEIISSSSILEFNSIIISFDKYKETLNLHNNDEIRSYLRIDRQDQLTNETDGDYEYYNINSSEYDISRLNM